MQQQQEIFYIYDDASFKTFVKSSDYTIGFLTKSLSFPPYSMKNKQIYGNNYTITFDQINPNIHNSYFDNVVIKFQVLAFIDQQQNTTWYRCTFIQKRILKPLYYDFMFNNSDQVTFKDCQFQSEEQTIMFFYTMSNCYLENVTFQYKEAPRFLLAYYATNTTFNGSALFAEYVYHNTTIIDGQQNYLINNIIRIQTTIDENQKQHSLFLNNSELINKVERLYYTVYLNPNQSLILNHSQVDINSNYIYFDEINNTIFQKTTDQITNTENVTTLSLYIDEVSVQRDDIETILSKRKLSYVVYLNCTQKSLLYMGDNCIDDDCNIQGTGGCDSCTFDTEEEQFTCSCQERYNVSQYCTLCEYYYIGPQCEIDRYVYGGIATGIFVVCVILVIILWIIVQKNAQYQSKKTLIETEPNDNSNSSFI